jgi:hypothetical protein
MELLYMWGHTEDLTIENRRGFIGIKQNLSYIKVINNSKAGKQEEFFSEHIARKNGVNLQRTVFTLQYGQK